MPSRQCPICAAVLPPGELGRHRREVHGDIRGTPRWTKLRAQIIARDQGRCTVCGSRRALQVHHRDDNPFNNDPSNLQTLCWWCHRPDATEGRPPDDGFADAPDEPITAGAIRLT